MNPHEYRGKPRQPSDPVKRNRQNTRMDWRYSPTFSMFRRQHLYIVFLFLLPCSLLWQSCQEAHTEGLRNKSNTSNMDMVDRDLDSLLALKRLTVLTKNSSTSYYIYKGQAMGFEYDLLHAYAKSKGMELEVRVVDDLGRMYDMLDSGEGDLIAANFSITSERAERVAYTEPLLETHQVLVQKRPDGWNSMSKEQLDEHLLTDVFELAHKKVHVNPNTSFYTRLYNLAEEMGAMIQVQAVSPDLDTETLIRYVALDSIKYTVADENVAKLNQAYYPELDVSLPISLSQKIAWATRKNATDLINSVNSWLASPEGRAAFKKANRKYFGSPRSQGRRVKHEWSSLEGERISAYDHLIKQEADRAGMDWRLVAAIIFQESNFEAQAVSWAGAFGLMQLMPATAAQYGLDTTANDQENIMAGLALLKDLEDLWKDKVSDPDERLKFILASYNVGAGHILDARQIARQLGLDPDKWTGNVEECILLKSKPEWYRAPEVRFGYCRGVEPYEYVREVGRAYSHYQQVYSQ